ncbi:hypothetical protein CPT_Muenster_034 [Klebsiella phage Muenster]|nr:hypothetical protein CPT_Muenster_034 [Klebsiella phage Muenster]
MLLLVHSKNNAQAHRVPKCIYSLCSTESLIFLDNWFSTGYNSRH